MKNGEYFKGIFYSSRENSNDKKISQITSKKDWGNFGYYKGKFYYMNNDRLEYGNSIPKGYTEITYQQYEDWILGKPQSTSPNYEIY